MSLHSVHDPQFRRAVNIYDWTLYPGSLSPHGASIMKYEDPESLPDVASPVTQRAYVDMDDGRGRFPVTRHTIICGDGEIATVAVECVGGISGDRNDTSKAVFEVIFNGVTCIAKCWAPEGLENKEIRTNEIRYAIESKVYETIERRKANGVAVPDCFASCFFTGQIMCSSIFPQGYIIVMEKRSGHRVADIIEELSFEEQNVLIERIRDAISLLDECDVEVGNPRLLEDMLFCQRTGQTTLIDFASLVEVGDWSFMDETEDETEPVVPASSENFVIGDRDDDAVSEDTVIA
ncbi:hypothetical protein N7481_007098 [Penicillium waksmanii]|uniref:uncharacterized protein n=1 Tax=Penicillium waksmanii TaxID=69791 RepID=UPI00254941D8|nr:uncharacterized protein N7481_007098 [Penicillium waksmanii]KAJ5979800.1 hypothetical protein N7481_007098 [Penicillium waksmanii]